jgi:AcrR family transcriptional regulator
VTTAIQGRSGSRRERLRAATLDEIKQAARRLLVEGGAAAISLRAIAREMGLTAAALYRYFPNLEALAASLCADLYDECTAHLERARDACPPDDVTGQMYAVCREFRRWSIDHPAEFGLMFGSPLPGLDMPEHDPNVEPHAAGGRFAAVFAAVFARIWFQSPFPVPEREELGPSLCHQLDAYLTQLGAPLPVGAAQVFLSCWIRLYGIVCMEVFGHLHFALSDPEPMFEAELAAGARQLGLEPRPLPPPDSPLSPPSI